MSYTIANFETKTSVGPSDGAVLPSPVISQATGAAPTSWEIEKLGNGYYRIWTRGQHAVEDDKFVFLSGDQRGEWKIHHWSDYGPNVYSIAMRSNEADGWVLEGRTPGTPVQCVTLPPTGNAMWVIQPPLP